jgi:hypothetical protein
MRTVLSAAIFCLAASLSAQQVTLKSLLEEMVDRSEIAKLADPAYKCLQWSSYDRRSVTPDDQNHWYANMDRSWFIRKEQRNGRLEHVMMDEAGPGAIVRIWTTWDGNSIVPGSTLRIYLDGSDIPAIEGPVKDLISGGALVGKPLSMSVSEGTHINNRGHNLYLPIPYSKSCLVTFEIDAEVDDGAYKSPAFYYQINFRSYEPGADVESFSKADLDELKKLGVVEKIQNELSSPTFEGRVISNAVAEGQMGKGGDMVITAKGELALSSIELSLEAEDMEQALRSTIAEISFDDRRTVWVPVGVLFGLGHKADAYNSWWASYDGETMYCHWTMPFKREAKIRLFNTHDQTVSAKLRVKTSKWDWNDRSLYFHGVWSPHYKIDTQTGPSQNWLGAVDINFAEVYGEGKWAGDVLTLFNGSPGWWGEGDEKIWVDGEDFPSHIGTGTEDYYGYAWSRPAAFSAPFIAQPNGEGNLAGGYAVNLRWRSLDAIPFDESIKFDMELWHWVKTKMNFEPASFFYARPGAVWNVAPKPRMAAIAVPKKMSDVNPPFKVKGAIEAEEMVVDSTGGELENQSHPALKWSGGLQVWWKFAYVGDQLALVFDSKKTGPADITAMLTVAVDYGIASFSLNGKKLAQNVDLYSPDLSAKEFTLGRGVLKKTGNVLVITLEGANEAAVKSRMIGVDYLKVSG